MSKLILASQSKVRQKMLKSAGFDFEVQPASIDERKLEKNMTEDNFSFEDVAQYLADSKALHIAGKDNSNLVIGSDQILVFEEQIISKAMTKEIAVDRLKQFRGKTHTLISAVSVARYSEVIFQDVQRASLTMRDFDDEFLKRYVESAGDVLTSCVGCYALEQTGAQLFEKIDGDYFTILGMPLLPLIGFLQVEGFGL